MGESLAKRIVIALGLGVFFSMAFDDSAFGLALGFAVVFGLGLFADTKD